MIELPKKYTTPGEIPPNLLLQSDITHRMGQWDYFSRGFTYFDESRVIVSGITEYYTGGLTIYCDGPKADVTLYTGHAAHFSMPYNKVCMKSGEYQGELTMRGIERIMELVQNVALIHLGVEQYPDELQDLYLEARTILLMKAVGPEYDVDNKPLIRDVEKRMNEYIGLKRFWDFELMRALGEYFSSINPM